MVTIERFDPDGADLTGYHAVLVASQAADRPEEPPLPLAELAGRLAKPLPGMGPAAHWVARRGDGVVAFAQVHFLEAENSGIGLTDVVVHPAARRSGIGTALLPELRAPERREMAGRRRGRR